MLDKRNLIQYTVSGDWKGEAYLQIGPVGTNEVYDSPIYYYAYSTSHHYSVKSQGDSSAHIMECKGCGITERQAHILNLAANACKICGRSAPFTTDKSIPTDDILSIDVLLPSSEAVYSEAQKFKKDN